jgi:hypothetical protein
MENQSTGTTVTTGPQLEDQIAEIPEIPAWLNSSVPTVTDIPATTALTPDPKDLPPARVTNRQIMHMQFENMFDRVLEEMAEGRPIAHILRRDARGYESSTYIDWIKKDPQRTIRYENAQLLYAEKLGSEIIEIADAEDTAEDVQRSKLRIDSRKWLMGVYNKRRYGDTKTIELGGSISITDALAQARNRVIDGEVIDVSDVTPKLENE